MFFDHVKILPITQDNITIFRQNKQKLHTGAKYIYVCIVGIIAAGHISRWYIAFVRLFHREIILIRCHREYTFIMRFKQT